MSRTILLFGAPLWKVLRLHFQLCPCLLARHPCLKLPLGVALSMHSITMQCLSGEGLRSGFRLDPRMQHLVLDSPSSYGHGSYKKETQVSEIRDHILQGLGMQIFTSRYPTHRFAINFSQLASACCFEIA